MSLFEVDRKGLRNQIAKRGKAWILGELLQNAWDAIGVQNVSLTLTAVAGRPQAHLVVEDDSPGGFPDLSHAFTFFAPSEKLNDPTRRGRFNLGEKLVIAIADSASIVTATGSVYFEDDDRRLGRKKRDAGTVFEAVLPMTRDEAAEALTKVRRFIAPSGIRTTINGTVLIGRQPIREFKAELPTVLGEIEGHFVLRDRTGDVRLYKKAAERAWLYELGIPVVELGDDPFDVDVGQKIPVNWERNNVRPSWLRMLRAKVLSNAYDLINDRETAASQSVTSALAKAAPEAIRHIIQKRFGDAAIYDPSYTQANGECMANGRQIVHGGTFDGETWEAIKAADALRKSSDYYPKPEPLTQGGKVSLVPPTPAMARFETFCIALARKLLGHGVEVLFHERMNTRSIAACYSRDAQTLGFNMDKLGKRWFENPLREDQLDLVIHEFGHDYASDHLSMDYHRGLTMLAARVTLLALAEPEFFRIEGDYQRLAS